MTTQKIDLSRREMLVMSSAAAVAAVLTNQTAVYAADATLPALPYAFDALEPYIDAQTMEIHHDRHHKTYIDKLNAAIADQPALKAMTPTELVAGLEKVPESIRTAVRNHGGGHLNHSLFWQMMAPGGGKQNKGAIGKAIDEAFGSFDKFATAFATSAAGQFGSGWAWLVVDGGKLAVMSTPNQDNPITQGKTPLLGVDVWEHAYYLKYQNKRPDYVTAWWNVVNWEFVNQLYKNAKV